MRNLSASLLVSLLASTAVLSACSQEPESTSVERVTTVDIEENSYGFEEASEAQADMASPPPPPPPPPASTRSPTAPTPPSTPSSSGTIPVSVPQIAYRYAMGFRVPNDAMKPLQNRHADMCEARGQSVCRIISMRQAEQKGDYSYGSLQLAVAASAAREFSKELETSSGTAGGELVSSSIDGEDLSKQIVDTEARLRARTVLRDRLMEVLRNRRGTVAELVEAERGVADVNQEIDQANSWLSEMRGRVSFSQMAIAYEAGSPAASNEPGGFSDPIRSAWGALGSIFGSIIAFLMLAFTVIVPLLLVGFGVMRGWRWFNENYRKKAPEPSADLDTAP